MNIIVTGASKGMGKAIAIAFAKEGANLFLCARNETILQQTAAEISTLYPSILVKIKSIDLSKKEGAQALGEWVNGFRVPIDILVNNAGQFLPGSIYNEPEGLLEKMIETNLYSAYHLTRKIVPQMIKNNSGHIFNICSIASLNAYPNGGGYGVSKFAMMGFSKNLREELKPYNIKVTAVYPGAVLTDSWGDFDNSSNRIMEAEDIATMIVAASKLSPQAVVEDIVLRPQLGDL
ncbi:SDR family oxidoreductase [Ferruginibacter lapsinanis]|uniref:SDR family oxidoreductase n=1 Tax=Ferruginibacter lapsinanis TaxID=563172 RepID=UPI001E54417E|nr:SDR family oxidoreductase [Ferruginibacter lapsinanis]UEG51022.1 SDR family oxidoreductase [Ferruginibacter lapsinanis]